MLFHSPCSSFISFVILLLFSSYSVLSFVFPSFSPIHSIQFSSHFLSYYLFLPPFPPFYVDAVFITESLRLGEDDEEAVEGVNAALGAMLSASPEDGTKVCCHSFIHFLLSCFIVVVVYLHLIGYVYVCSCLHGMELCVMDIVKYSE